MQENYNIEDTGNLLTQTSRGGRNKRLILITVATVAVLVVALVAGYFVISDKKYEDQIAIANKAFAEGNYDQAEAAFIKAMDMKKRESRAREGLAYTYAVEGKYKEASEIYEVLYEETKEEKHKKGYEDTSKERVPADYGLVPAKGIWRSLPEDQVGYYTSMESFLFGLEADYLSQEEGITFDCDDAENFPALQMIMTGIGNYDLSIEDYYAYVTSDYNEKYLKDTIMEWRDGVDPKEWILEEDMYSNYETADAETADTLMKDVFNISDDVIDRSLKDCEEEKTIYLEDGTYYCVAGWTEDNTRTDIEVKSIWSDGSKYCVKYYGGWGYEENWGDFEVDRSESYVTRYAVIEPKLINGEHYWSLYSVSEEMPKEVADGLKSSKEKEESKDKDPEADRIFSELEGKEFVFASGAGGWSEELTIHSDGTFEGYLHDSNMGETGKGYPDGTIYICNFTGRFSGAEKVSDHEYRFTLDELKQEGKEGDEYIEDDIKYVISYPYGIKDGKEFALYLPDAEESELPQDFIDWVTLSYAVEFTPELGCYGINNLEEEAFYIAYE